MRLYENAFPDVYEEIKTWYPVWYREILEMDALWRVWGKHLDEIQAGIIRAVDNNFIGYADAQTITKLEHFLDVDYDGPRTLAERRDVIKAFFIGQGRIGRREITDLIAVFTNGEIEVAFFEGTIQITVTRNFGDRFNLFDCRLVLDRRIPAHLDLSLIDKLLPVTAINEGVFIFCGLNMNIAVRNLTAQQIGSGVLLDGEMWLDGTWKLDTSRRSGFCLTDMRISIGTAHSYRLTGALIIDNRWRLDGTVKLDGSRSFSYYIEEEV